MVARGNAQSKLKITMAAGVGAVFLILGVVGGVVGWLTRDKPEQLGPPQVTRGGEVLFFMFAFQNYMSEKDKQEQGYLGGGRYNVEGQHVNSVLVGEEGEGGRRTGRRGYKGDRGLRVRSIL